MNLKMILYCIIKTDILFASPSPIIIFLHVSPANPILFVRSFFLLY